jgi:hypothetical protein
MKTLLVEAVFLIGFLVLATYVYEAVERRRENRKRITHIRFIVRKRGPDEALGRFRQQSMEIDADR